MSRKLAIWLMAGGIQNLDLVATQTSGANSDGQLGEGDTTATNELSIISVGGTSEANAAAATTSMAVTGGDELFTWGNNSVGQLGLGDTTDRQSSTQVGSDSDWDIPYHSGSDTGDSFSIVIKTDGTIWGSGLNDHGQLGAGSGFDPGVVLTRQESPNTVWVLDGVSSTVQDPVWDLIASGSSEPNLKGCALASDGRFVVADLDNIYVFDEFGPDGVEVDSFSAPVSSSGVGAITIHPTTGNLIVTDSGNGDYYEMDGISGTTLNSYSTGGPEFLNGVAIDETSGNVVLSGIDIATPEIVVLDGLGGTQLDSFGTPSPISNPPSLSIDPDTGNLLMGDRFSGNTASDDEVFVMDGLSGTLLNSFSIVDDGSNDRFESMDFLATATTSAPTNISEFAQIGTDSNWEKLALGWHHVLGIKTDGTLWAWGRNDEGQLGQGDTTEQHSPVQVGSSSNWVAVAAGANNSFAINSLGELYSWGDDLSGSLGRGGTAGTSTVTQVGTATDWADVKCKRDFVLALKDDGTLYAWGDNTNGQLGQDDTTNRSTPTQIGTDTDWSIIDAGDDHALGIRTDTSLWGWGANGDGQLGLADNTDRHLPVEIDSEVEWRSVHAGAGHTLTRVNIR